MSQIKKIQKFTERLHEKFPRQDICIWVESWFDKDMFYLQYKLEFYAKTMQEDMGAVLRFGSFEELEKKIEELLNGEAKDV